MLTFKFSLVLETYLMDTESREISLKRNLCDFSIDYNAIDKSDILNIHKYLMVNNSIK